MWPKLLIISAYQIEWWKQIIANVLAWKFWHWRDEEVRRRQVNMGASSASINMRYNCLNSTFFTQTLLFQMYLSCLWGTSELQELSIQVKIRRQNYNIGKYFPSCSFITVRCIQEKVSSSWYMFKLNSTSQKFMRFWILVIP